MRVCVHGRTHRTEYRWQRTENGSFCSSRKVKTVSKRGSVRFPASVWTNACNNVKMVLYMIGKGQRQN